MICVKLVFLALCALFVACSVHEVFVWEGPSSMEPTVSDGSRIVVKKEPFDLRNVDRFDLLLLYSNESQADRIVRRVIGLPGEEIEFVAGAFFSDGEQLEYPEGLSLIESRASHLEAKDFHLGRKVKVPDDAFYLVGDNLAKSYDSKIIGPYSADLILGEVLNVESAR